MRKNKGGVRDRAKSFPQNRVVKPAIVVGAGWAPAKQRGLVLSWDTRCSDGAHLEGVCGYPQLPASCLLMFFMHLYPFFILLPPGALPLLHISARLHAASTSVL